MFCLYQIIVSLTLYWYLPELGIGKTRRSQLFNHVIIVFHHSFIQSAIGRVNQSLPRFWTPRGTKGNEEYTQFLNEYQIEFGQNWHMSIIGDASAKTFLTDDEVVSLHLFFCFVYHIFQDHQDSSIDEENNVCLRQFSHTTIIADELYISDTIEFLLFARCEVLGNRIREKSFLHFFCWLSCMTHRKCI